MSVSKNRVTSLSRSERKTLISFLLFYALLSIVILAFSGAIYYMLQKEVMLKEQEKRLKEYSYELISKLRFLHNHFDEERTYPRFVYFDSAIYDSSGRQIFSTLSDDSSVDLSRTLYTKGEKIYYVRLLDAFYLGAMYVVIEITDDMQWLNFFKMKVIFYGGVLFLILLVAGYFLMKLLLKPMRDTLYLLDHFIKDTTHELNTPVSAILANIETIDPESCDPKNYKKIRRIDIAARTISQIYNDLTYVVLGHQTQSKNEKIDLTALIKERAEFFKVIAEPRKLRCLLELQEGITLYADRNKISRLIDNLLSNAIKYNRRGGYVRIILKEGSMVVEDSGIGIEKRRLNDIFERYRRFNESEGGFGLGLSIVLAIAREYGMKISIDSIPDKGTKVKVIWQKR